MNVVKLAETVKLLRSSAKLTQKEVAEKAGCSVSHIKNVENRGKTPSLATLEKIINACGYDLLINFRKRNDRKNE